jgi:plastocyanin
MKTFVLSAAVAAAMACGGGSSNGGGTGGGGTMPTTPTSACTAATAQATTSVSMAANLQFVPNCIMVSKGATVTWTNTDSSGLYSSGLHGVISDTATEPISSPPVSPGQTFQHTFSNTAQTVNYHCTIHGTVMSGVVVVE